MTTGIDDFPGLMREWAEWVTNLQGLGYSDSTALWRAQFGKGGESFASSIPAGMHLLEAHGALRRLIDALNELRDDADTTDAVECVQWAYLYGAERGVKLFGKSRAKYYQMLSTGETLIKRELKRR